MYTFKNKVIAKEIWSELSEMRLFVPCFVDNLGPSINLSDLGFRMIFPMQFKL